jgi:hypothetical protein
MAVRGKFTVAEIHTYSWGEGKKIVLNAVTGESGIPEDERYHRYTPSGKIEMYVDNPRAEEQFKLGQAFYVDFTPVV